MPRGIIAVLVLTACFGAPADFDWGTYNPGAYINLRSRLLNFPGVPLDTINAGVLWGGPYELRSSIQDSTYLFSYLYNSPGRFAVQNISDQHNFLNLTSTFQVDPSTLNSWQLTLSGYHAPKTSFSKKDPFASIVFHISLIGPKHDYQFRMEAPGRWTALDPSNTPLFSIEAVLPADAIVKGSPISYYCKEVNNTRAFAWNAADYAKANILNDKVMAKDPNSYGFLPNKISGEKCNLLLLQTVAKMPFEVKYRFNDPKLTDLQEMKADFDGKLEEKFGPIAEENRLFAKSLLSNLLGGIGYFTGPIKVAGKGKSPFGKLFTCTPSRITFPRGFLWDEGFHLSIVCQWDQSLCIEILKSWFDTQDESGWIPREQIRGEESEGRVPSAFLQQNDSIANPPSLLFPVMSLYQSIASLPEERLQGNEAYTALQSLYPKLVKWLQWLYRTQMPGGVPAWAGRSSDHNLASGLDDYPRSQIANDKERHLDLHCWMTYFAQSLTQLATLLGFKDDAEMFGQDYQRLLQQTKPWFFDQSTGLYNDYIGTQWVPKGTKALRYSWRGDNKCGEGNPAPSGEPADCNPYSDSPCCSEFGWCGATASHCKCPKCTVSLPLDKRPDYEPVDMFSPHIGYVTLFPLIHGLLPQSDPAFSTLLATIRDTSQLWTPYGLRSLSKSSRLYKTGENYWRGNVWINVNYLLLRGIQKYYWGSEEARSLYTDLRNCVVRTVKGEWESSRSLHEQYSDENGRGKRARAFYGWSAVTLLILQERYA